MLFLLMETSSGHKCTFLHIKESCWAIGIIFGDFSGKNLSYEMILMGAHNLF